MLETNAVFHDGKSPRSRSVRADFDNGLVILAEDGALIERWPLETLEVIERQGHTVTLTQTGREDDARLRVIGHRFSTLLLSKASHLGQRRKSEQRTARLIAFWSVAAALSLVLLTILGIPYLADRLAPLVPPSVEARLGQSVKPQIYSLFSIDETKVCREEKGQRLLDDLVRRLSIKADIPFDISIEMVQHSQTNAFALPGGQIVVLNKLLDRMPDGEAFAAVIAHEIGHVANRDVMRRLIEAGGRSFILSSVLGDFTGGTVLLTAAEVLSNAAYSRERESAADAFAVTQLAAAGADPGSAYKALEALVGKEKASDIGRLLASHPVGDDRLAALREFEKQVNVDETTALLTESDWQVIKSMCAETAE
ncbi:M48 family metallopeptidase [Coralliovum pocilloporae]|uniref:M48 family metallopeptidase n=1 Tax=Coralliovum pocilloporae TaxID=3066369 RepID=UPI003307B784